MKQYSGFDRNDTYKESERLPAGGYVVKVLDVKEVSNDYGNSLVISFDIAEGEFKDFYKKNYQAQQGEDKKWKGVYRLRIPKDDGSEQDRWTKRRFNTVIVNFEQSNSGYHWNWDEATLKGKIIGAVFNNKEYEFNGRHGFFTNCHSLIPVENIRNGKFKIPDDTLIKKDSSSSYSDDGFMNIPDSVDDEGLPFN